MQKTPTWITANQRLALHLRQQYDQTQQLLGRTVWETADCLSLKNWLTRTYQALPNAKFILSEHQELAVWEDIITHALTDMQPELALLSTRSLAKTAQDAWHLLKGWETPLSLLAHSDSHEVAAFYRWATMFDEQCQEKNWVDFSTCVDKVITSLGKHELALPTQIILAGFEEISPQTQRLFDILSTLCKLSFQDTSILPKTLQKVGLENEETELQAMAQWAYKIQAENPGMTIGCVLPNLSFIRHDVERIFNRVFASKPLFNISGGQPFHRFGMIQTAFDILQLGVSTIEIPRLSRLLTSPFLGGAEKELTARAALDIRFKETQEYQIYWKTMQFLAEKQGDTPIWLAQCHRYLTHFDTANPYQETHAWSQYFSEQLQYMGWPGERSLDSSEYQQVKRWQLLLEEFNSLGAVLGSLSKAQALHHLYHLAQATVFQPETTKTPVQILGLLEAVGLSFDYLWIAGMTQENWPGSASPNPFIPIILQRTRLMPHASAERELAYSRALTKRFSQSAATVIFSYALQKEDRAQISSALILDIPEVLAAGFSQPLEKIQIDKKTLEYFSDEFGPELQADEIFYGGASIFKHQAACPFKAFSKTRLNATSVPISTFSVTPQERGMYLHAALEEIWKILGDHQTLCEYDEPALEKMLQPIVHQVLSAAAKKRPFTLRPRFIALEKKRLTDQIKAWLTLEKQRAPFRVLALESEREIQFAGLTLKLRVDREDELNDGTRMIIDYKTGECSPANWFGDRPDDPQLPLYGLTCNYSIDGLAFAQIWADKLQFLGISDKNCGISGVLSIDQQKFADSLTWDVFFKTSEITLTRLAQEFQAGHAVVDPKQPDKTCRYCDLQSLCRIHEKDL